MGHSLHFPLNKHYQESFCFSRETNLGIFLFLWLWLRRCKFRDPVDLSLDAFHSLGATASCTTANQERTSALVISGEEVPQIHSAIRAQVSPQKWSPR